jgi:hypothetical protein
MDMLSTFLFAEPSFAEGMARVLDLGGNLNEYNRSLTDKQADFWAIYADWRATGEDIRAAELGEYCRLVAAGERNVRSARREFG